MLNKVYILKKIIVFYFTIEKYFSNNRLKNIYSYFHDIEE